MPFLSFCAIVRDEARRVGQCLASVAGLADELIVVDTGSADATPDLCRAWGARVCPFPWTGDFAAARNHGLAQAAGEWILWLDADEVLHAGDPAGLLDTLAHTPGPLLGLDMRHYTGLMPPCPQRSYTSVGYRFFRRAAGISFTGRIHEHLALPRGIEAPAVYPHAWVEHFGYLDEVVADRDKGRRNLELLLLAKAEAPDPWLDYHIAAEAHRAGDCRAAYIGVNDALAGFLARGELPPAQAYKLKYELLLLASPPGELPGVLPGLDKALLLYPEYVDLHFCRGVLLWRLERYAEGAEAFRRCLDLGERPGPLTLTGTGSFYALYYLALCAQAQGDLDGARTACTQALALYPQFSEARGLLDRLPPGP